LTFYQDLRALNLELFTLPSNFDFLRDHQHWFLQKLNKPDGPHRQACGTSRYAQTDDILSKEHLPTAKAVVLCVEG